MKYKEKESKKIENKIKRKEKFHKVLENNKLKLALTVYPFGVLGASGFFAAMFTGIKGFYKLWPSVVGKLSGTLITIVSSVAVAVVIAAAGIALAELWDKRRNGLFDEIYNLKNKQCELEQDLKNTKVDELEKLKEDEEKANKAITKSVKAEQQVIDVESKEIVE